MDEKIIVQICLECFGKKPETIERCAVGQGNYVYIVECVGCSVSDGKYVIRCSEEHNAYVDTIVWLKKLSAIAIPVPEVILVGYLGAYEYLILTYVEGKDLGLVYPQLKAEDKRTIAKEIVQIQERVSTLELNDVPPDWSWSWFIDDMLERARARIVQNGYFNAEKVDMLTEQAVQLDAYFVGIKPTAYLDDVSTKNLLIHNGSISGIIDIDWIGMGDKLTYAVLTYMALLNMEYDTDYVTYILEEMHVSDMEKRAFLFYALMYCVDFMGERGMQFMDKKVEVNEQVIDRLNKIYGELWERWRKESEKVQ